MKKKSKNKGFKQWENPLQLKKPLQWLFHSKGLGSKGIANVESKEGAALGSKGLGSKGIANVESKEGAVLGSRGLGSKGIANVESKEGAALGSRGLGSKGIAIIGVLTAGAISLIVLAGTTQMLLQLTSRIGQQEDRAKRKLFHNWLAVTLQDPTACKNTLAGYDHDNPKPIGEIRNNKVAGGGEVLMDFYNDAGAADDAISAESKKRLADEFGVSNFGQMEFKNFDSSANEAELVLYTKSKLHGAIPIYNKDLILSLTGVTLSGGSPNRVTACSVDSVSLNAVLTCLRVYGTLTLAGCGATTEGTGVESTAYGYNTGGGDLTGDRNTFVGFETGQATTSGPANTFIGNKAGAANTTGGWNVFMGHESGKDHTTGNSNVFVGNHSGFKNTTGYENVFLGNDSGIANETGGMNVFVGHDTGRLNTADNNTFIGRGAGFSNLGAGNTFVGILAGAPPSPGNENIFIGHGAAAPNLTDSNKFILGGGFHVRWIAGDIGADTITINGNQVCLQGGPTCAAPSSRVYKKNIKKFKDFGKSLEHIVNTSLFTYQYKENHPEKTRMGIISEELPESLQIQVEGAPSRPDWPSIYGTLWAGIQSLAKKLTSFKLDTLKKMEEERLFFSEELDHLKENFSLKLKAQLKESRSALYSLKKEWNNQFAGEMENHLTVFKKELFHFKNRFETVETRLKGVEGLQVKAALLNQTISSYREKAKAQQKQLAVEKEKFEKTEKALLKALKQLKKRKEVLTEAEKRLSAAQTKLLKNQMEDKEKFKSYNQKLKKLEGKLKTWTSSGRS